MWIKEKRLAYLGGIIDGEGCIKIIKRVKNRGHPDYNVSVEVGNCDSKLIIWLKENFGGYVYLEKRSGNHKDIFRWHLNGKNTKEFLREVKDYLLLKTPQADLAINFLLYCQRNPSSIRSLSLIKKQEEYWKQMAKLNHRGKEDLEEKTENKTLYEPTLG